MKLASKFGDMEVDAHLDKKDFSEVVLEDFLSEWVEQNSGA